MLDKRIDLTQLWQAWPIRGPWRLSPLSGGTNNQIWRAETANGERYALRVVPDLAQLERFRSEAALLVALSKADLPFSLPLPVPTQNGENIAFLEDGGETLALATLLPYLSGERPDRNNPLLAQSAGAALAVLDNALAALPERVVSSGRERGYSYGNLVLGSDPLVATERLPVGRDKVGQIQHMIASVLQEVVSLYGRLPQHLLHLDYVPSNILMQDQRVTAVFDFEFAGYDLQIMELAVALSWWPVRLMGTGKEWEVMDAFAMSYLAGLPLSEEELSALPSVLRLREVGSLIHRMHRYFAGLETDVEMQERVEHSLWREAWLLASREVLLQHTAAWLSS